MPDQLQLRGGTTAEHSTFTGASKEVTVDTTKKTAVVHDGTTAGGIPLLRQDGSNSALALGSQGTPSLKWDANTGIYSPGEDQLAVATNGTSRLSIDASGNVAVDTDTLYVDAVNNRVGIGATSPGGVLEAGAVSGAVTAGDLLVTTGSTTAKVTIGRLSSTSNDSTSFRIRDRIDRDVLTVDAANFVYSQSGTERARIDSSGRLLVGTGTARANFYGTIAPQYQIEGTGLGSSMSSIISNRNDAEQSYLVLAKTRGAAVGSNTVVQSGDYCGTLSFHGADGAKFIAAASIDGVIDGTPGTDDMPGRLVFSTTADGAASPTERMRIKANGDVSIVTGNLIIGTAGKGIDFSADGQAAGMTSELLDDYEEGTWTAGIAFDGGTTGITYGSQLGVYTKIGRMVTCIGVVQLSSKGSSSGAATITGLPFTVAANEPNYGGVSFGYISNMTFASVLLARTVAGATTLTLGEVTTAGVDTDITNADFTNTTSLRFAFTYFV